MDRFLIENESGTSQEWTEREQRAWYHAVSRLPPEDVSLGICARHRATAIERRQFLSWPEDAQLPPDMHLGLVSEIKARAAYCPLCALVVACATDMAIWEEIPNHVDDVDVMSCWVRDGRIRCKRKQQCDGPETGHSIDGPQGYSKSTSLRLRITFYDHGPGLYKAIWRDIVPMEKATKCAGAEDENLFCGRPVSTSNIDGSLMRQWVTNCKKWHSTTCGSLENAQKPNVNQFRSGSIRLLDLEENRVIDASDPLPYVCLSYVWGANPVYKTLKDNLDEIKRPGSLAQLHMSFAKSIRDAIAVTRMIGQRYIWIDSLCIVQDDDADKGEQISQMDQIYLHAELTIVVAGGDNADCGIDGLAPGSRSLVTNKATVYSEDTTFVMLLPELSRAIAASTWNTRGWTYQEMLLSKRKLVFANDTVYFQCAGATWGEDYVAEHPDMVSCAPMQEIDLSYGWEEPNVRPSLQYTLNTHPGEAESSWFNEYVRTVTEYTSRELRFESDRVAAFGAVLSNIAHTCNVVFVQGMPEDMLLEALLWQPKSRPVRVSQTDPATALPLFPSWSWAGWTSAVEYDESTHDFKSRGRSRPFAPMAFVELGGTINGAGSKIRDICVGKSTGLAPTSGPQDLTKYNAIRMRTRIAHFNLVVYDASGLDDPNGRPYLRFGITLANPPPSSDDRKSGAATIWSKNVTVEGRRHPWLGALRLPGNWRRRAFGNAEISPRTYEFVVLSEAYSFGADQLSMRDALNDRLGPYEVLDVMLVERVFTGSQECGGTAADGPVLGGPVVSRVERRGVGKMLRSAWDMVEEKWETIDIV